MLKDQLTELAKEHGTEAVIDAAEKALNTSLEKKHHGGYAGIIQPVKVDGVVKLIDATLEDVTAAGEIVEKAYGNRGELKQAISQLEADVKITEATAFMEVGPDNTVDIDGRKVKLSNGEMRDMYRRYVSREERKKLAEKQGELEKLEQDLLKAKDRWDEAKEASSLVQAKAYVQANLLKFLS